MPRVNIGRDPAKERQETTRRIIRRGMAELGINCDKDVAERMGMSKSVFSKRMASGTWAVEEMVKLFKLLHLTENDAAVIMGIRPK